MHSGAAAMRTRDRFVSAALAAFAVAAACVINPDPRSRSLERAVTDGRGGWVVVDVRSGAGAEGELIAVDPDAIRVLTTVGMVAVPLNSIAGARLWTWEAEHTGALVWG